MNKRSIPGIKDESGAYVVPEPKVMPKAQEPTIDVSIDDIGKRIVIALDRATKTLLSNITSGSVDRDTIGALKDCASVLKDLKKEEKDYLSELSDEQLAELIKK